MHTKQVLSSFFPSIICSANDHCGLEKSLKCQFLINVHLPQSNQQPNGYVCKLSISLLMQMKCFWGGMLTLISSGSELNFVCLEGKLLQVFKGRKQQPQIYFHKYPLISLQISFMIFQNINIAYSRQTKQLLCMNFIIQ